MLEALTNREREILQLLSAGKTNQEIADQLILSTGTVKAHTNHIFGKLAVANRTQALRRAQEWGLLDDTLVIPRKQPVQHCNLPANVTPFIGRKKELDTLANLMLDSRVRLITILGAGGMGKTQLALETARHHLDLFPDGIFMVSLAQVSDARNIAPAIIDAMGIPLQPGGDLSIALRDRLQNKKTLLVLDNFEHVLGGADLVLQLLAGTNETKLLVTSRERLNLSAEVLFVLSGMDYEMDLKKAKLMQSDAAQLLIHRAHSANPLLEFSDVDWSYIARICQLTQGMPLAIVLAAGWLEMLSLGEIADEIGNSIDILESQLRDLPERQRSMRATITSSWNRLTPEEQHIFASLSAFRGGFTREAAQQVTGATLRQLQTLVNRSFISAGGGRYEIHELLRQFGSEQLERSGDETEVFAAHSSYFLHFLHQRENDLKGRRQRAALDEIHNDYENVELAWMWTVEKNNYDGIDRAVDCLCNFAVMRAFLVRAEELFEQTLNALNSVNRDLPHPLWDKIALRHIQNRHRLSLSGDTDLLTTILERARIRNDRYEIAYCLWVLANQVLRAGDQDTNQASLEESLMIWRQMGDEFYVAHVLAGIIGQDMSPEGSARALPFLHESIDIRRRIGDDYELSFSLSMMGIWLLYICEFDEAERYFDECISLQDESHRTPDFAGIVGQKGSLLFWRGDFEIAAFYAMIGLDFSQDMNYYGDRSTCQALMSFVCSMRGDYSRAKALCEEASRDELFDMIAAGVYWGMALACCGLDNDDETRRALAVCLKIACNDLKSSLFQNLCLPIVAILAARSGEPEYAVELLGLAFAQPSQITGWLHKWTLLAGVSDNLKTELGVDQFNSAWAYGGTLELDKVMTQLLETIH